MSRFLCTDRSYELLEPYEGKLSRTVRRGERGSNVPALPDSLPELAREANMSSSKLQKCFKQVIGSAIAEYALSEKMEWAKRLLSTRLYSVSEVGYEIGYTNLSHFTEAFHKHHKIKPKQYLDSL